MKNDARKGGEKEKRERERERDEITHRQRRDGRKEVKRVWQTTRLSGLLDDDERSRYQLPARIDIDARALFLLC